MAPISVGVGGVPKNLSACYIGVDGARRTVTSIYVGTGGMPRLCWQNIPPIPTTWAYYTLLTANGNWVVPTTAWYKVYCVGKSGDGGKGGDGDYQSTGYMCGGGGAGGNSGGVSVSTIYLKAGTSVPVTVTTATTSFSSYLSATAGGNGGVGAKGYMSGGAAGGVASTTVGQGYGGSISNSTGLKGGNGGKGGSYNENSSGDVTMLVKPTAATGAGGNSPGYNHTEVKYSSYPGPGGSGNNLQGAGAYYTFVDKKGGDNNRGTSNNGEPGWSSPQSLTSPPVLYGSGGGGAGSQGRGYGYTTGHAGGIGTPGCIIIERGA